MNKDRALKKAIALARAPELHQQRMDALLARIKQRLPELEKLLVKIEDQWGEEDGVYRLYHQSYKVFGLQKFVKTAQLATKEDNRVGQGFESRRTKSHC
jgi:hypothetical protein